MPARLSDVDTGEFEARLLSSARSLHKYVSSRIPGELRPVIEVEDVVQEVWVAAYCDYPALRDRSPNSFDAWLKTIADRTVVHAMRGAQRLKRREGDGNERPPHPYRTSPRRLSSFLPSPGRAPMDEAIMKERVQAIGIAVGSLPHKTRQAIRLHHIEGWSITRIAAAMGKTTQAVAGLLFRGRKVLREALGDSAKSVPRPVARTVAGRRQGVVNAAGCERGTAGGIGYRQGLAGLVRCSLRVERGGQGGV